MVSTILTFLRTSVKLMDQPSTSYDFKYDPYLQNIEDTQEKEETKEEIKIFKCYLCAMEETYDYKGKTPNFLKNVIMLEDCYVMEDPFSPPGRHEFLTLGADCSVCEKSVCKGLDCSFFYSMTYCKNCLKTRLNTFPYNVQMKIKKLFNF